MKHILAIVETKIGSMKQRQQQLKHTQVTGDAKLHYQLLKVHSFNGRSKNNYHRNICYKKSKQEACLTQCNYLMLSCRGAGRRPAQTRISRMAIQFKLIHPNSITRTKLSVYEARQIGRPAAPLLSCTRSIEILFQIAGQDLGAQV